MLACLCPNIIVLISNHLSLSKLQLDWRRTEANSIIYTPHKTPSLPILMHFAPSKLLPFHGYTLQQGVELYGLEIRRGVWEFPVPIPSMHMSALSSTVTPPPPLHPPSQPTSSQLQPPPFHPDDPLCLSSSSLPQSISSPPSTCHALPYSPTHYTPTHL